MTVLLPFSAQNFRQCLQRLLRINHTGRIIGRIDQHCRHILRHHLLKPLKVYLERYKIRRNHLQMGSRQIDIRPILRKIGREGKDRIPRNGHRAECMRQGRSRSAGHENMIRRVIQMKPFFKRSGHRFPCRLVSQSGTVPMQFHGTFRLQQFDHLSGKFIRNGHRRVPQAVIENIFISDLGRPLCSISKGLPDH